jgi:hypothetical protein
MKRFVMAAGGMSSEDEKKVIAFFRENGASWWKWIENFWLIVDRKETLSTVKIRDFVHDLKKPVQLWFSKRMGQASGQVSLKRTLRTECLLGSKRLGVLLPMINRFCSWASTCVIAGNLPHVTARPQNRCRRGTNRIASATKYLVPSLDLPRRRLSVPRPFFASTGNGMIFGLIEFEAKI